MRHSKACGSDHMEHISGMVKAGYFYIYIEGEFSDKYPRKDGRKERKIAANSSWNESNDASSSVLVMLLVGVSDISQITFPS